VPHEFWLPFGVAELCRSRQQLQSTHMGLCEGPNHDPYLGFYLDVQRSDYVFAGLQAVQTFVAANVLNSYLAVSVLDRDSAMCLDPGAPRYIVTLRLVVSADACGTFTYMFESADWGDRNLFCDLDGNGGGCGYR